MFVIISHYSSDWKGNIGRQSFIFKQNGTQSISCKSAETYFELGKITLKFDDGDGPNLCRGKSRC